MTRRFEFTSAKSNKFWEITVKGKTVTLQYGRIGTDGQKQTKSYATPAAAQSAAEKQVAEKLKKGYKPAGKAAAHKPQKSRSRTATSKGAAASSEAKGKNRMPWNPRTEKWRTAALVALAEGRTRLEFILPLLRDDPEALRAAAQGGLLDDELTEALADPELERLSFRYVGEFDEPVGLQWEPWELNRRTTARRRPRGASNPRGSNIPLKPGRTPLFSPSRWTGSSTAEKWARRITKSANWRTSEGEQDPSVEFFTLKKMPQHLRSDPDFIGPLLCAHGIIALAFAAPELQSDPDILGLVFAESATDEGGSDEELLSSLESCLLSRSAELYGPATVSAGDHLTFNNEGREVHVFCLAQDAHKKWKSASEVRSTFLTWAIESSDFHEPDIAAVRIRSKVKRASEGPDCTILDYEVRSPYNNTIPSESKLTFFVRDGDDIDDEFEFEDEDEEARPSRQQ